MAQQDISLRYNGSLLGPFWISIAMGITALGVGLLYSTVFEQDTAGYIRYLAIGFMAWNFMTGLITEGSGMVMESAAHLRSLAVPLPVLSARMVFRNIIVLLHNLLVVALIVYFTKSQLTPVAFAAIGGVLMIALIGYFLALALGPLCARYRDVPQIVASVLQLAFFMTPVFWHPEQVSARPWIRDWNPFYHLLELVRAPLYDQHLAAEIHWIAASLTLLFAVTVALVTLPMTRKSVSLWV